MHLGQYISTEMEDRSSHQVVHSPKPPWRIHRHGYGHLGHDHDHHFGLDHDHNRVQTKYLNAPNTSSPHTYHA